VAITELNRNESLSEETTQNVYIKNYRFYGIGLLQIEKTMSIYIDIIGKAILLILYNNYTTGLISLIKYKVVSDDSISSRDNILGNLNPDIVDILSISPDLISTTPYMWIYMIYIVYVNIYGVLQLFTHLNILSVLVV